MGNGVKQYDEKVLLLQIAEGDEIAFRHLFDFYKERLFTFAFGLTHSKVDAEEIVQDIFLKLWESRTTLSTIIYPQSYIYTMARNRALDLLASTGRNQKLIQKVWANITQSEELTEHILQAKESQQLIYQAVAELTEKKQQIFELSRNDGLSHDEISNLLGISKQTVKNNLSEALKQIKLYLERHSALLALIFWLHHYKVLFQDFH